MGLLATIAVPGGTGRPRWVELLRKVGRDPMGLPAADADARGTGASG